MDRSTMTPRGRTPIPRSPITSASAMARERTPDSGRRSISGIHMSKPGGLATLLPTSPGATAPGVAIPGAVSPVAGNGGAAGEATSSTSSSTPSINLTAHDNAKDVPNTPLSVSSMSSGGTSYFEIASSLESIGAISPGAVHSNNDGSLHLGNGMHTQGSHIPGSHTYGPHTHGTPSVPSITTDSDSDAMSMTSVSSIQVPSVSPQSWAQTTVGDLVSAERLVCLDRSASVEAGFDLLAKYDLTCLPLTENGEVVDSFDYADLTGYLLLVLGHITVKGEHELDFQRLLAAARRGIPAPVGFAAQFGGARDPFVRMSAENSLVAAFEKFARGVHRIAITSSASSGHVVGVLSQRRLVRYVWENLKMFPSVEAALEASLYERQIGTYGDVICINGDAPVLDALDTMHEHAVSSVAVVDSQHNLLGNISVVDVSLLTRAWQAGLLQESCKHFLTVILDHRGIADGGNESVPVFYVQSETRLAKVVAMLVATRAHRLWICEPSADPAHSGKLVGVVSLTDVLNFIMRQAGQTLDPETARRHRRSSSSSVRSNSKTRHSILHGALDRPRLSFDRPRPPLP